MSDNEGGFWFDRSKTVIENGTEKFEWNGFWISNPYLDETGRFEVVPEEYYNMTFDNEANKWVQADPDLCRCHGYPEDECPFEVEYR
jgi:hypothetical protein